MSFREAEASTLRMSNQESCIFWEFSGRRQFVEPCSCFRDADEIVELTSCFLLNDSNLTSK